jgi:uncharacterized tellurite resistance protein B-like protein
MERKELVLQLGKLVIAAAWADGKLENDEINLLKELLFQVEGITGEEWKLLEIYMASPVKPKEADRLLEEVIQAIRTESEKELVLRTLTDFLEDERGIGQEESEFLKVIREEIDSRKFGLFSHMGIRIRNFLTKRLRDQKKKANRETRFDDYIENTVYFLLKEEEKTSGIKIDIPEEKLRKLCLGAGLMARVSWVDKEIDESERESIRTELQKIWRLNEMEAFVVTEVSCDSAMKGIDYHFLSYSFFNSTEEGERVEFIKTLFKIANSSNKTSVEEIEEIRKISRHLKVSHQEFIEAKLTIPREDRDGF